MSRGEADVQRKRLRGGRAPALLGIERLSASEAVRAVERLGLRAVWATEPGEPPSMQAPAGGVRNAQLAAQQGPGQSPTTPAGTVVLFGEEHRDEVPPAPTQRCS